MPTAPRQRHGRALDSPGFVVASFRNARRRRPLVSVYRAPSPARSRRPATGHSHIRAVRPPTPSHFAATNPCYRCAFLLAFSRSRSRRCSSPLLSSVRASVCLARVETLQTPSTPFGSYDAATWYAAPPTAPRPSSCTTARALRTTADPTLCMDFPPPAPSPLRHMHTLSLSNMRSFRSASSACCSRARRTGRGDCVSS